MNTNVIINSKPYSEKFKKNIISMYLRGRNGRRLRDKYGIPKSTFYFWAEEYKKIYSQDGLIITKHDYKKLEWENDKIKKQLEAYQITGCSPQSTDKDKLTAIDKYRTLYPIKYLCTVLNINRTKFYRYIMHKETQNERHNKTLTFLIKEIASDNPCYGSKRICHELKGVATIRHIRQYLDLCKRMVFMPLSVKSRHDHKGRILQRTITIHCKRNMPYPLLILLG